MKNFRFKVTVHGWDEEDHTLELTGASLDEVAQKAVHEWGRNSSYEIHLSYNDPFVCDRQGKNWAV